MVSGVPLGSVLGPLIFNLLIGDLLSFFLTRTNDITQLYAFVDDTIYILHYIYIYIYPKYIYLGAGLQRSVDYVTAWANDW